MFALTLQFELVEAVSLCHDALTAPAILEHTHKRTVIAWITAGVISGTYQCFNVRSIMINGILEQHTIYYTI